MVKYLLASSPQQYNTRYQNGKEISNKSSKIGMLTEA
jgi:hypothetical protein